MARTIFFLSLLTTTTSTENTPSTSTCTSSTPRLIKFISPPKNNDACTSSQLGDSIRSPSATSRFFHSLDTDDSGIISRDEMAHFLKDRIGGSQFSNSESVNREVGQVMKRLDMNSNGLEMEDVEGYWRRLESLLTAEEVSEWVVYAVQLPPEVGRIFLQNGVTGYDFPEIVQNSGSVLQNELGLKSSFVGKIVRGVQANMLGIGSTPEATKATFQLVSCRSVSLKWSKSQARIFPVHSYRVQRRAIDLFGGNDHVVQQSDIGSLSMLSIVGDVSSDIQSSTTAWKTIYVGGETEYVDSTLDMGHNYMYRIQAWNSVGRSAWEVVDLERALRKKGCSTKPKKRISESSNTVTTRGVDYDHVEDSWEWLSLPKRVVWGIVMAFEFVYHSARFFFMVIAMGGAIMRFKRASATSSASAAAVLPFPWFWKGINRLSVKLFGQECIPRTMLGDKKAILMQEQMHDDQVRATGLRGYSELRNIRGSQLEEEQNGNGERSKSEANAMFDNNKIDRRSALTDNNLASTSNLTAQSEPMMPPREVTIHKGGRQNNLWKHIRRSNSRDPLDEDGNESITSPKKETMSERTTKQVRHSHPQGLPRIPRSEPPINDGTVCIVCQKKFKLGKRYKHHCSRCMATFCHKHGKTTHSNFTSCRVPGSCLCNPCVELISRRRRASPPTRAETVC